MGPKDTREEIRAWPLRAPAFGGTGVKRGASGTVAVLYARSGSDSGVHCLSERQVMPGPGEPWGSESGNQYEAYGARSAGGAAAPARVPGAVAAAWALVVAPAAPSSAAAPAPAPAASPPRRVGGAVRAGRIGGAGAGGAGGAVRRERAVRGSAPLPVSDMRGSSVTGDG